MNTRKIHFSNVKQIIIMAPGASGVDLNMIWTNVGNKKQIKFEGEYECYGLEPGYLYCPYCGNIWKPTVHPTIEECGCDGKREVLTSLEDINNCIWKALSDVDPMDVKIIFTDDHEELFTLREN